MTCICIRYNNHYIYCTDRIQNNIVPSWLPRQLTIDQDFRHGHQHLTNVTTANDKERVIKNKISSHLQTGVFFFVLSKPKSILIKDCCLHGSHVSILFCFVLCFLVISPGLQNTGAQHHMLSFHREY